MNQKNIYLIGFMASGKSSFGKKLANFLERKFLDLDSVVEEQEKCTITDLFKQKGELYFRSLETKIIKSFKRNGCVVSLGGGTPCFNDNLQVLQKKGIVIYLELPLKILIGRLKQDKENRPLVKDLDNEQLLETISELFKKRERYYKKADLILDASQSDTVLKKEIQDFISYTIYSIN